MDTHTFLITKITSLIKKNVDVRVHTLKYCSFICGDFYHPNNFIYIIFLNLQIIIIIAVYYIFINDM